MELKITNKKENSLLKRTDVEAEITFTAATPSNDTVGKSIAANMKVSDETIVVKQILTKFGETKAKVFAYVYASKADLNAIEPKFKKAASKTGDASESEAPAAAPKAEEKKPEAAPAKKPEEKKPEAAPKADEKKEEKKPESVPEKKSEEKKPEEKKE